MAGSIALLGSLDLTEAPVPGMGEIETLKVRNTGTTKVKLVSVEVTGDGAKNVMLSKRREPWSGLGQSITLDSILPDSEVAFYARAVYHIDDAEDRQEFNLVIKAVSVG